MALGIGRVDNASTGVEAPGLDTRDALVLDLVGHPPRVLNLVAAAGRVTSAVAGRGGQVTDAEMDDDGWPARFSAGIDTEGFDVVLATDVLQRASDPLSVLRAGREALRRGGCVVLSVPNITHADVALARMHGTEPNRTGFTRSSLDALVRDAGLLTIDLCRVRVPVFYTDVDVQRDAVSEAGLAEALADEEAETDQFVLRAVVDDGDAAVRRLADRAVSLQTALELERAKRVATASERDAALEMVEDLQALHAEALRHVRGFEQLSEDRQRHIDAMQSTRSYRMLEPLRSLFGRRG